MNEADKAIEEIREVRHRISAECDHDVTRYIARLREEEKKYPEQVEGGRRLSERRHAQTYWTSPASADALALRDQPKP